MVSHNYKTLNARKVLGTGFPAIIVLCTSHIICKSIIHWLILVENCIDQGFFFFKSCYWRSASITPISVSFPFETSELMPTNILCCILFHGSFNDVISNTCKRKKVSKLNSTEIDFWRRSAWISRKDKIRNTIIKQKINVTRSLLDDIKTKQLTWYGHVQRMEEGRLPKKSYEMEPTRKKKTKKT